MRTQLLRSTNRPTRELVFQTSLEMIIDFSFSLYAWFDPLRIVHLILFDDVLLVAEAGTNQRLRVKFVFPLDLLKVRDLQSSDDYVPSSFQLIHPSRTITFVAQDEGDKRATLDALLMSIALASMERQIILTRGWQYQFLTGSLFESAIHGNIPAIQRIVMRDPTLINLADVNGWTPLFYAAIRNQPRAIHALCRAGARVNITDSFGLSALHYACMYQRPPSVDALLEHKADVHRRDRHGRTPLFLCAIHEDPILHEPIHFDRRASALCISLLQTAVADINITDNDELTPLERNICVSVAKCRLLLECGAKMELYDNENSLLHLACDSPRLTGTPINPALVDLLLQFGAQPNQVNLDGQTPLDLVLSAANQQPEVLATVELLVSHGARIKQGCISREISNAQLVWRAKRRVLYEAINPTTSTKPSLPQSSCYICKAKHAEDLIKMCSACHLSVCADCSTKQIGYLQSKQSNMSLAHYDLPPSVHAERVCDGCFNSAFYAERGKAAMSQRLVRRGRSGSLHASSQFTS
ncbi:hypothetical protein Ae201684P_012156 [Aphanomyces euteiches]|nr:hypothetical protein Ae201684P_012156 [Aphanomyces euteiches]